jgi:hypothetical protein
VINQLTSILHSRSRALHGQPVMRWILENQSTAGLPTRSKKTDATKQKATLHSYIDQLSMGLAAVGQPELIIKWGPGRNRSTPKGFAAR